MHGHSCETSEAVVPRDGIRHEDVGRLRLSVGCEAVVGLFGEVWVVEVDGTDAVAGGGDVDDAACAVGVFGGLEEEERL